MSCCSPDAFVSLATRSMEPKRSSLRRSVGRGTVVDSETVVDSNVISCPPSSGTTGFLRISAANIG